MGVLLGGVHGRWVDGSGLGIIVRIGVPHQLEHLRGGVGQGGRDWLGVAGGEGEGPGWGWSQSRGREGGALCRRVRREPPGS